MNGKGADNTSSTAELQRQPPPYQSSGEIQGPLNSELVMGHCMCVCVCLCLGMMVRECLLGVGQRRAPMAAAKMASKNLKKADLRNYLT